jgi:hypothetical protein
MSVTLVPFPASYWPGGSGNLGTTDWNIGYYSSNGKKLGIAAGGPGPGVVFGVPWPSSYQPQPPGVGGVLSGNLAVSSFSILGGARYSLSGMLSASGGNIAAGTQLTVDAGAALAVTNGFTDNGVLINSGSIAANAASSIDIILGAGGSVTNHSGGAISGYTGILAPNAVVTVFNAGSVAGDAAPSKGRGINLRVGGSVTNQNNGMISGYYAVVAGGGALTALNAGSIVGNTTTHGIAVSLNFGGSATNQSGGTIRGYTGIFGGSGGGALTVNNAGSIGGNTSARFGEGIQFAGGGSVTNQTGGVISGFIGIFGRPSSVSVTVLNSGGITGGNTSSGRGIYLGAGGSVTNLSGGSISGFYAILGGGASTVVNAGVVAGNMLPGTLCNRKRW